MVSSSSDQLDTGMALHHLCGLHKFEAKPARMEGAGQPVKNEPSPKQFPEKVRISPIKSDSGYLSSIWSVFYQELIDVVTDKENSMALNVFFVEPPFNFCH